MSERTFKVADSCLSCKFRKNRIEKNVICEIDNAWRSERLVCSSFEKTDNKNILNAEKKMLPDNSDIG